MKIGAKKAKRSLKAGENKKNFPKIHSGNLFLIEFDATFGMTSCRLCLPCPNLPDKNAKMVKENYGMIGSGFKWVLVSEGGEKMANSP